MDPELTRQQQQEALKRLHDEMWREREKILSAPPRKSAEVHLPAHERAIEDEKHGVEEKPMWLHPDHIAKYNKCDEIGASWAPTHRHLKTGGLYRLMYVGLLEKTLEKVAIYQGQDLVFWVRPLTEFEDGRFEALIK
jgi:hypothetical protein